MGNQSVHRPASPAAVGTERRRDGWSRRAAGQSCTVCRQSYPYYTQFHGKNAPLQPGRTGLLLGRVAHDERLFGPSTGCWLSSFKYARDKLHVNYMIWVRLGDPRHPPIPMTGSTRFRSWVRTRHSTKRFAPIPNRLDSTITPAPAVRVKTDGEVRVRGRPACGASLFLGVVERRRRRILRRLRGVRPRSCSLAPSWRASGSNSALRRPFRCRHPTDRGAGTSVSRRSGTSGWRRDAQPCSGAAAWPRVWPVDACAAEPLHADGVSPVVSIAACTLPSVGTPRSPRLGGVHHPVLATLQLLASQRLAGRAA